MLETWTSPKSMETPTQISVLEFAKTIVKEYEWIMEAKVEQVSVQLQDRILPVNGSASPELYLSTINNPIVVCWPKGKQFFDFLSICVAMKYYRKEDFMSDIYPKAAKKKKFGIVSHRGLFRKALEDMLPQVDILNARLDIL